MSTKDTPSLAEFIRHCWPVEIERGWHLDCICDHLEAVASGKCKRILINVPRQHYGRPPPTKKPS